MPQTDPKHILITGALSGIGLGLLKHYHKSGWKVTAVNKRSDPELEKQFPGARFHSFGVNDIKSIDKLFADFAAAGSLPRVYVLSAGINKVDNVDGFDVNIFREVMEVNFTGVVNFVGAALPHLKGQKATFVSASSTTNLFPNPNCLGYYVSKLNDFKFFELLDKTYCKQGIQFKSLVLGPVQTNIFVSGKLASKLQSKVRDLITVTVEEVTPLIVDFIHSNRKSFYYSKLACLLFITLRAVNTVWPGFYKGSVPDKK